MNGKTLGLAALIGGAIGASSWSDVWAAAPTSSPATTKSSNVASDGPDHRVEPPSIADLSLEDLMNIEVTTVSKKKQAFSHTPGAISLKEVPRTIYEQLACTFSSDSFATATG